MDDETRRFRRLLEPFGSPSEKRTQLTHKGKARCDRDDTGTRYYDADYITCGMTLGPWLEL